MFPYEIGFVILILSWRILWFFLLVIIECYYASFLKLFNSPKGDLIILTFKIIKIILLPIRLSLKELFELLFHYYVSKAETCTFFIWVKTAVYLIFMLVIFSILMVIMTFMEFIYLFANPFFGIFPKTYITFI